MRGLIATLAGPPRTGIAAALERLLEVGALRDCERCGEPIAVASGERIAASAPVYEIGCRCTGCGLMSHVRQVFDRVG